MIRTCDGADPNLVRDVGQTLDGGSIYVSCDCGLTFDDVDRVVIWPHERIPTREERNRKLVEYAEATGDADLADWLRGLAS